MTHGGSQDMGQEPSPCFTGVWRRAEPALIRVSVTSVQIER